MPVMRPVMTTPTVEITTMVIQTCFSTAKRSEAPPSNSRMIWFSAESALISTRPSAWGPTAMPARRNSATSGTRIFCARRPTAVPIVSTRAQDISVCLAISIEVEDSTRAPVLVQRLQPGADFAGRDIGLVEQLAHGEEAMELAGKEAVGDANAGLLETLRIFIAFVAQGI